MEPLSDWRPVAVGTWGCYGRAEFHVAFPAAWPGLSFCQLPFIHVLIVVVVCNEIPLNSSLLMLWFVDSVNGTTIL